MSCWGLVCLIYREVFGVTLPRHDQEEARVLAGEGGPDSFKLGWLPVEVPEPGDVVHMMGVSRGRLRPTHCGIRVPGGVLQAQESTGSIITNPWNTRRAVRSVIGAYRIDLSRSH